MRVPSGNKLITPSSFNIFIAASTALTLVCFLSTGIALIALKNKVNILPIHIEGTYKIFSKITVDIYPMIEISDFENMEDAEAIDKLTEELFYKIYQGKNGDL